MSRLLFLQTPVDQVATPEPGYLTVFVDSADKRPKYKRPDGVVLPFGGDLTTDDVRFQVGVDIHGAPVYISLTQQLNDMLADLVTQQQLQDALDKLTGGGDRFPTDFTISLNGGGSIGKYKNGQLVPAKGKTALEFILDAAIEDIYPQYNVAGLGLSQSLPVIGELGEVLTNTLVVTFYQNDAGPIAALRIYRDGASLGSASNSNSYQRVNAVTRSLTAVNYSAQADYAAGVIKPVPPSNRPDDRPAAVRNSNAPQAAENNLGSNQVVIIGYYRAFWGAVPGGVPNTPAAFRSLPSSALSNPGQNQFTLNTGTTATELLILLPPGTSLLSVTDIDNQGLNLTTKYIARPTVSVNHAGAIAVGGYTPYVLSVATPYTTPARHVFTYA